MNTSRICACFSIRPAMNSRALVVKATSWRWRYKSRHRCGEGSRCSR
uniref:Uncharacterized protein n=1 Tax=Anguilla anguilla TaxID=7936 RepID=A0A0E9S528_ANGAN